MKRFLCTMAAMFIIPIVLIGAILYGVSYVLQLLFRTIILYLDKGMTWVDRNITQNMR